MSLRSATSPRLSGKSQRSRVSSSSSERELVELAHETRRSISWPKILSDHNGGGSHWKWLENVRDFSIYVNESSTVYSVLAMGTIKGSVSEIESLLVSSSQAEYEQKMFALNDKAFKQGTYVRDLVDDQQQTNEPAMKISLRTASFATSGWLQRDDEWCFVEATQHDKRSQCFERFIATVNDRKTKQSRNIRSGLRVQPKKDDGCDLSDGSSQVQFYAEVSAPNKSLLSASGPSKAAKQRLLLVAQSCGRLSQLVRRRRLGVQVLADERRLLPLTNTLCVNCDTRQLVAKLCRICGQGVCAHCSAKYEREVDVMGKSNGKGEQSRRARIESVRVCDPCISRVDQANYDGLSDAARRGPQVFPDQDHVADPAVDVSPVGTSAQADLKYLLQDALLQAPSQRRKSAVMSVIRSVLEQEKALHQPVNDQDDHIHALKHLQVKNIPHYEAELADKEGRAYLVPRQGFPVPQEEGRRLQAIKTLDIHQDGTSDELNIICDIAARELGTLASIITLITEDAQCVIGANTPAYEKMGVKREEAFCQHTVMDTKPLIVRHPEADIRFSKIKHTEQLGIRYYCGFPIMADDDVVIGTLCCLDRTSHEITESQYTALKKLAETASKIVRMQGERKRQRAGSASSA